jgi:hypothetical protein
VSGGDEAAAREGRELQSCLPVVKTRKQPAAASRSRCDGRSRRVDPWDPGPR